MSGKGTFISFGSLDTGKSIGALLLPGNIDIEKYPIVDTDDEDIELNRFYTTEEMIKLKYEKEVLHNRGP